MLTDRSRRTLHLCSSLAIATALAVGAGTARAQSFAGNGTFDFGSGTITTPTPSSTVIDITSSDAVITWTTNDANIGGGPINFQPAGTTATFQRASDFSVLNRIIPTDPSRAIQFNGNVIAQITSPSPTPGGTVYFYSPGGVIVGGSAVFNVGNLGLTSIDPEVVGGVFEQGGGPEFVRFNGAVTPGSAVQIQPGAQITSNAANGSYVALVAPVINHGGTINVNGVAALVSADAATITFNPSGLFDIQVTSGTSGTGTPFSDFGGTITGPAYSGAGPLHRVYAVAVPKNTAITMLIGGGGSLGFDIAGAADVVGNAVVLSGGFDVLGGVADTFGPSAGGGTGQVVFFSNKASVTSAATAAATGAAKIYANPGETVSFASDLDLRGASTLGDANPIGVQLFSTGAGASLSVAGNATVTGLDPTRVAPTTGLLITGEAVVDATNGGNLSIGGDLTVHNDKFNPNGSATAGQARIAANGGSQLVIGGDALITAVGSGGDSNTAGVAVGDGTGGLAFFDSRGASTLISVGGVAQIQAFGFAGNALAAGALSGTGTGGNANLTAVNGGRIAVTGNADLNVQGSGASAATPGTDGSNGTAGIAAISQNTGGRITIGGDALLLANGFGGDNLGGGDLTAGDGRGGDARIAVNDPGGIQVSGNVIIDASGVGGDGVAAVGNSVGGTGRGGLANIGAVNGLNRILGNATVTAAGFGGSAMTNSGAGGAGLGGTALIGVIPGTNGGIAIGNGGASFLGASGVGGAGSNGGPGGSGTGGTAQIFSQGGVVTISDAIDVHATGNGGNSANGLSGSATGGLSSILASNAGSAVNFTGAANLVSQSAAAFGGVSGGNGTGGAATGGNATIDTSTAGQVSIAGVHDATAIGFGGGSNGGAGGAAQGGSATVNANTGSIAVGNGSTLTSSAFGGSASATGAGGNATSGTSTYFTSPTGGSIAVTGNAVAFSVAQGGSSTSGAGGNALSTGARFLARNGTITVTGQAQAVADANGGNGLTAGGTGTGGDAALVGGNVAVGGSIMAATANVEADAVGGSGTVAGNATGGTARIVAGAGAVRVTGATSVSSDAFGGNGRAGGAGGTGTAGMAQINALNNTGGAATIVLGATDLTAVGSGGVGGAGVSGGTGGAGGTGFGGNVQALGGAGNGNLTTADLNASAVAFGGTGGTGGTGATGGTGGAGGVANGGFLQVGTASFLDNSPTNTGSGTFGAVSADASAFGGDGGAGGSGTTQGVGGRGGDAFDGSTVILVRGSPVRFNGVVGLFANAIGGDGGGGSTAGVGGNATIGTDPVGLNTGGLAITVTNRFQHPEQPGSLISNGINGQAQAIAGGGSIFGASRLADGPIRIDFTGATVTESSGISLVAFGQTPLNGAVPSLFQMAGATATIPNLFLSTLGDLTVTLDNSTANVADLTLSARNFVLAATQPTVFGTFNVSNGLSVSTGQDFLVYANINAAFDGAFTIDGSFLTGSLDFNGDVDIDVTGSLATRAITANGTIDLKSGTNTVTGALTATDSVFVDSAGPLIVAGAVSAGIVNPLTPTVDGYRIGLRSATSIVAGNLAAQAAIGLSSPGTVQVGSASAGSLILGLAGTGFTSGPLSTTATTGGRIYIANNSMESLGGMVGPNFNPAPILAAAAVAIAGPISISSAATAAAGLPAVNTAGVIQAASLQALTVFGATTARTAVVYVGGASVSAGNITVGDLVNVASSGAITLGNVDAGLTIPGTGQRKIAIGSNAGPVSTGALSAFGDLGVQTGGALSTGALRGRDVLLLVGGALGTGAVSAVNGTQPTGRIYVGNFSMANQQSNVFAMFNGPTGTLPIFNTEPVRIGGGITFNGAVLAQSLFASAAQGISLQGVTAGTATSFGFIDLDAGGLVSVNGRLAAGDRIDIASGDMDITASGSLDALSLVGEIQIASNNPNGMFVGDGLTPASGSYQLSNAEYGRLKAGQVAIIGDDLSGTVDMTVGDLSVSAAQLYTDGEALFATGNRATETPSGILRVNGNIVGTGFALDSDGGFDFLTGTFELNAATGSVNVTSSNNAIGGEIDIEASRIHVASDTILTKLRADPLYAGHVEELNRPAPVRRPDGVLRAGAIDLFPVETLYIQNTGTAAVPAGFFARPDDTDIEIGGDSQSSSSTAKAELVFNGQFETATGVVVGKAAYDLAITRARADAMAEGETFGTNITDPSTFNGCTILTGACAATSDPVASLSSEITVVTNATLDDSPVAPAADDADEGDDGSSDDQDDESATDEGSAPIAPPTPLINTRQLDANVDVIEPVSGAGNPALFGSAVDETTAQGEPQ